MNKHTQHAPISSNQKTSPALTCWMLEVITFLLQYNIRYRYHIRHLYSYYQCFSLLHIFAKICFLYLMSSVGICNVESNQNKNFWLVVNIHTYIHTYTKSFRSQISVFCIILYIYIRNNVNRCDKLSFTRNQNVWRKSRKCKVWDSSLPWIIHETVMVQIFVTYTEVYIND